MEALIGCLQYFPRKYLTLFSHTYSRQAHFFCKAFFFFQIRQAAITNYFQEILNRLGKYAHALVHRDRDCLSGCLYFINASQGLFLFASSLLQEGAQSHNWQYASRNHPFSFMHATISIFSCFSQESVVTEPMPDARSRAHLCATARFDLIYSEMELNALNISSHRKSLSTLWCIYTLGKASERSVQIQCIS